MHLDRARADEQGLADLPAGVAPGHEQHDLQLTAGQAARRAGPACAAAGGGRPRLAAQLAQCRGARGPQDARTQPAGGVVGRVQELHRRGLVTDPRRGPGRPALGLSRGVGQLELAEFLRRAAQLAQCRLRLIGQKGLAPRVGERGDRLGLAGGLGHPGQGGRARADVGVHPLLGEERGHPLQDQHAEVPFLRPRQPGQHPPGPVGGLGARPGRTLQHAQPPGREQLHRHELDPGGDQVALQQVRPGLPGRAPHRVHVPDTTVEQPVAVSASRIAAIADRARRARGIDPPRCAASIVHRASCGAQPRPRAPIVAV